MWRKEAARMFRKQQVTPWRWSIVLAFVPCIAQAQSIADLHLNSPNVPQAPAQQEAQSDMFNLPLKTMGGQQFWTDVQFAGGWHIQRNVLTGHHRLLDSSNVRRAWGTKEQCQQVLQEHLERGDISNYRGKVVILLHGLMRTHRSMDLLCRNLRDEWGFQVINFEYASGRGAVQEHAQDLAQVIEHLGPEVTEISFVGHSLGNIVVRNYLFQLRRSLPESDTIKRLKAMVMLGPPNQGSRLATWFSKSLIFSSVTGASGRQLSRSWEKLESELAVPSFPFAIIAGGSETANLYERTVWNGPSDFVVSVEETYLPGATETMVAPVSHTFMMQDSRVIEAVGNFLNHQTLSSAPAPDRLPARSASK